MQNIIMYAAAAETLGVVRDYAGAQTVPAPTLALGSEVYLRLRLFAEAEGDAAYPLEQLSGVVSWCFVMDNDFDRSTAYKIVADNESITAGTVIAEVDGTEYEYTEIDIPISEMASEELLSTIGTAESIQLNAELCGYNAAGKLAFVLQIKGFTIRNRISSIGNPTIIDPEYLNEAQVRALIASGLDCIFCATDSADITEWSPIQTAESRYMKIRIAANSSGAWSKSVRLAEGPKGADSFVYIAYAADNTGSGFSLVPSNSLKYRAELHRTAPLASPSAADFADCVWIKYIGDDGAGDMSKAVYDTNSDGKVNAADSADNVPWDGVSGKPEAFPPAAHGHTNDQLNDKARQVVVSEQNPATFYLNADIIERTNVISNGTLTIDIAGIKTKPGGQAYTGVAGDVFTCELWIYATEAIWSVTLGTGGYLTKLDDEDHYFPPELPLKNNKKTLHVFTLRARYSKYATNNLRILVGYAYSEEA